MDVAGGIFGTQSSVIRRLLPHPVLVARVGGEAGPWRLQRLSPAMNPLWCAG